jgi:hypothetical protein
MYIVIIYLFDIIIYTASWLAYNYYECVYCMFDTTMIPCHSNIYIASIAVRTETYLFRRVALLLGICCLTSFHMLAMVWL